MVEPEPIMPWETYASRPLPDDARQLGLDRNTEEGALIAMAGSLNPAKLSHRLVAWAILFSLAAPLSYSVLWGVWRII